MSAKVAIFGSCVTRDAFAFASLPVDFYYARTTIASMVAKPCHEPRLMEVEQQFDRKMLLNDFEKQFPREIMAMPVDHLVIDCIDERFDNILYADTIVTRSTALERAEFCKDMTDGLPGIPLKTRIFDDTSIDAFCNLLNKTDKLIYLHEAFLAEQHYSEDYQGRVQFHEIGQIRAINDLLRQLYDKLRARLNCIPLRVDQSLNIADPGHKWGLAPFHYCKAYYKELINQYQRLTSERKSGAIKKLYHCGGNYTHIRCINRKLDKVIYANLWHLSSMKYG